MMRRNRGGQFRENRPGDSPILESDMGFGFRDFMKAGQILECAIFFAVANPLATSLVLSTG